MSGLRSSVASASRRLLRVLLVLGSALPAKTGGSGSLLNVPSELVDDSRSVREPYPHPEPHRTEPDD